MDAGREERQAWLRVILCLFGFHTEGKAGYIRNVRCHYGDDTVARRYTFFRCVHCQTLIRVEEHEEVDLGG